MIRKLQKKFILITMACLLSVTFVLLAAINITNFVRIDQRSEDSLEMISSRRIPAEEFRPDSDPSKLPPEGRPGEGGY